MRSVVFNRDCMAAMREMPDKAFDLAIVDPPYGIQMDARGFNSRKPSERSRHTGVAQWTVNDWDNEPMPIGYFVELRRVSRNCIIWGANHFIERIGNANSSAWLVWYKNGQSQGPAAADCELAWTTFQTGVRYFRYDWSGFGYINAGEGKIHPTQKPVALYKWLLQNYAKPGQTILDTHLGSGSSRIAAYDLGFDFTGYELDTDYFNAQEERFQRHVAQGNLFIPSEPIAEQGSLLG